MEVDPGKPALIVYTSAARCVHCIQIFSIFSSICPAFNPILAMPGFWVHMDSQPTPNTFTAIEVQLDKYVLTFSPADQMSPEICPENKFSPPGNHRLLSAVQNRPMCDFLDHFI